LESRERGKNRDMGDQWIPTSLTYQVCSPNLNWNSDSWVSSLIDLATGWWNYPLLRAVFFKEEVARIGSMALSPLKQEDKLHGQKCLFPREIL
jgi:hypothetical protein